MKIAYLGPLAIPFCAIILIRSRGCKFPKRRAFHFDRANLPCASTSTFHVPGIRSLFHNLLHLPPIPLFPCRTLPLVKRKCRTGRSLPLHELTASAPRHKFYMRFTYNHPLYISVDMYFLHVPVFQFNFSDFNVFL